MGKITELLNETVQVTKKQIVLIFMAGAFSGVCLMFMMALLGIVS